MIAIKMWFSWVCRKY